LAIRLWEKLLTQGGARRSPEEIQTALEGADREFGPQIYAYVGRVDLYWQEYDDRVLDGLGIGPARGALREALETGFRAIAFGQLFPETIEVLHALRTRRLSLGVISNHTDDLLGILERHGIRPFFDHVTYSMEAGAEKPDPRIFELALRRSGCRPDEAVHVGDSWEADVLGARRAGLRAIWVDRAGRGPDRRGPRVSDLGGVVASLDEGAPPG
ncbi:MAG TPA: HAD family hydrolase, partial [Thermoplasmata archaeon]|nr:HAD family hydrolase [Thermoplasmata archaeon]